MQAQKTLEEALRLPGVRDGLAVPSGGGGKRDRERSAGGGGGGGGGGASAVPLSDRVAIFVELASTLAKLARLSEAQQIIAEATERFRDTPEEVRVLVANSELAMRRNEFDTAVRMLNSVKPESAAYIHAQMVKANIFLTHRHDKRNYAQCYRDLASRENSVGGYERLGDALLRIQVGSAP